MTKNKFLEKSGPYFLLNTKSSSLLLEKGRYGHILLPHYGKKIGIKDAPFMSENRVLPFGSSVLYCDESANSKSIFCMNSTRLAWSSCGKGDESELPASITLPNGEAAFDFVFESSSDFQGTSEMDVLPSAHAESRDAYTLVLRLKEKVYEIYLELIFTTFYDSDVITRRAVLVNQEGGEIKIQKFMSQQTDIPDRSYALLSLYGAWINEANAETCEIGHGKYTIESRSGVSSNRKNPAFALKAFGAGEDHGYCYGFNLLYSGDHYSAVERDSFGKIRIVSGINPENFEYVLQNGENFESPEAIMSFSDKGMGGLSRNFHSFINFHVIRGKFSGKERPIAVNSWESFGFDINERKLLSLAKTSAALGAELFVVDDGWFQERNDDTAGLGNFSHDSKKFPRGLRRTAEKIRALGLKFGLWIEPEACNIKSDLFRNHPDFIIKCPERAASPGRNEYILDLSKNEVSEYLIKELSELLDNVKPDYIKWDFNRNFSDFPEKGYVYKYYRGLYKILRELFYKRPEILLESCASGGNRFDAGMLCFSQQIWASDNTDPVSRLSIQKGLSYFYPQSTISAHVSATPAISTLRRTAMSTRFNVAAFGILGYELDLNTLSAAEKEMVKNDILFYKTHRKLFQYGEFLRPEYYDADKELFLITNEDKTEAVLGYFQRLAHASQADEIFSVKGLNKGKVYEVRSKRQKIQIQDFGRLAAYALPKYIKPDGFVLRQLGKYLCLEDGSFSARCSAEALESGIFLNAQFTGTGYDESLRLWGDFGSQIYIISECGGENEQA